MSRYANADDNWYNNNRFYHGCRNCKHQIDVLRTCEWLESGGDGQLHIICPRWEKKNCDADGEKVTE